MKKTKISQGSNKDIWTLEGREDLLAFSFTDRISVFDWGALNASIPNRGKSLERFALSLASFLESKGIPQACDLKTSKSADCFVSKKVGHPNLDSQGTDAKQTDASISDWKFLPLEFIVRWGVPQGSSLLKRFANNDDMNFSLWQRFEKPMFEYSTKLEPQDRMLDLPEASKMLEDAGVSADMVETFLTKLCKPFLKFFEVRGLELWDAKFEIAYNSKTNELMLVDAITPDELRLTLKGLRRIPLSKEILRSWLKQTPWFDSLTLAKASAKEGWQKDVIFPQPQLGAWRSERLSSLYAALADLSDDKDSKLLWNWIQQVDAPQAKVAVIGAGGREEALRWRLKQEGVSVFEENSLDEVKKQKPQDLDAVFVSMDGDLAEGVVDDLAKLGFWTFGPSQNASKLEWSKWFGREAAIKAGIPNPIFSRDLNSFDKSKHAVPVLKLNGLAAGKGVFLFESWEALEGKATELSEAKQDFYFEEQCEGFEASIFFECLRDATGKASVKYLGSGQDFKRRFLGDEGPNTGGMGAWVPHPQLSSEDIAMFEQWGNSTVKVMEESGEFYRGILYVGAMKDKTQGWKLIEFNSRFGDPETQALVTQWPKDKLILRSMLQLNVDVSSDYGISESDSHSLCLSLVHPDYPEKATPLQLKTWNFSNSEEAQLFKTTSKTGRIGYLVAQSASRHEAGDKIFEILLDSPWKDSVEWRTDILK